MPGTARWTRLERWRLAAISCIAKAVEVAIIVAGSMSAMAQRTPQAPSPQTTLPQTIGSIQNPAGENSSATQKVQVAGAITLQGTTLGLGNGSTVTAGSQTLQIQLTRGGELHLCATTQVHLSQAQSSIEPNSPVSGPLMMALNRGALEAQYPLGKDSDVVLTPDLRILLSGPGQADVRIRVNAQGDTCVDNRTTNPEAKVGADAVANAPYVTVSEQMGDGVYRVQPNQRVLFEHGSLRDVVDNESEPCGCPAAPAISIASAGTSSANNIAAPGQSIANTATNTSAATNADTAFPIAESEGLAPPPGPPTQPVVAIGQRHVEVATTLVYDAAHPDAAHSNPQQSGANQADGTKLQDAGRENSSDGTTPSTTVATNVVAASVASYTPAAATPARVPPRQHKISPRKIFHHLGHFFHQLFSS